jgi:hypothetical protein
MKTPRLEKNTADGKILAGVEISVPGEKVAAMESRRNSEGKTSLGC